MSAEDGTYRFEALPPGEYKLDFHHRATDIEQSSSTRKSSNDFVTWRISITGVGRAPASI